MLVGAQGGRRSLGLARALSASGAPSGRPRSRGTTVRSTPPLPQPRQAAPLSCPANRSGRRCALHPTAAAPTRSTWAARSRRSPGGTPTRARPIPARRLLLGRLGARHALWWQLQAGGSSPTCSPPADLTRARCSRRAGPVGGSSKRPWAGHASTDPATDRLCRWCLSAASRSSAFCLRPAVSCRFAPLQRRFSGLPMVWIDQGWPK